MNLRPPGPQPKCFNVPYFYWPGFSGFSASENGWDPLNLDPKLDPVAETALCLPTQRIVPALRTPEFGEERIWSDQDPAQRRHEPMLGCRSRLRRCSGMSNPPQPPRSPGASPLSLPTSPPVTPQTSGGPGILNGSQKGLS